MTPEEKSLLENQFRTAQIVSGSMMSGTLAYGILAGFLLHQTGIGLANPVSSIEMIRLAIYITGASSLAASFYIPRIFLGSPLRLIQPAGIFTALVQRRLGALILSFALCECAAVIGLILCLQSKNLLDFYFMAGFALAGMVYHFPRVDQWETWIERKLQNGISG